MRDYGRVYSSFWTSADMRDLSDDGRLLALYLLSGPHGTIAGVCRLPDGYVCEDLGWTSRRVSEGFRELFKKGFANRCETTKWAWIRKFLAWNRPENPNQWKAARKLVSQIPPQCAWKAEFSAFFDAIESGRDPDSLNGLGTLSKRSPTQEQEQEQEQETRARARPAFVAEEIDGLDLDAWRDWIAHRSAIRKPIRPHALAKAARQLAALGGRQRDEVDRAIAGGWQGLHPDQRTNGAHLPTDAPRRRLRTPDEIEAEENARAQQ